MDFDEEKIRAAGVDLIVFFGSRARGQAGEASDWDLGVLFAPNTADPHEKLETVRDAVTDHQMLDFVVLNEADPLLLREVAVDGMPKFQGYDGAFEEFRLRAIKRYMDTQWLRDLEAEALRSHYG
ncbi:MAG: type VII toxin-antitoxin system MntA family adenylyltransferase antitoxin [Actinomycetota bacterium]